MIGPCGGAGIMVGDLLWLLMKVCGVILFSEVSTGTSATVISSDSSSVMSIATVRLWKSRFVMFLMKISGKNIVIAARAEVAIVTDILEVLVIIDLMILSFRLCPPVMSLRIMTVLLMTTLAVSVSLLSDTMPSDRLSRFTMKKAVTT